MTVDRPIKVLIVDDHPLMRSGIAGEINAHRDMTVVAEAEDGVSALSLFRAHRPDVTLLDLKMPRMGGIELLGQLAEQAQTIAVILVTAQGTIDSAVQAMRMGAYDYITKPIDTNRLRTILSNASALLGTRAELEATRP